MTVGVAEQRQNPPPAAHLAPTPSLSTSPATGASAGSPSRGGRSRQRVGGQEPVAPPTASEGLPGEAGLSTTRRRPSRWAPREGGPSAGPLGRGELLVTSSNPHSCRARPSAVAAMMTLRWRGRRRRGRPRHVAPIHRHAGYVAAPRRLRRRIFIGGDATLPRLPPVDAVVVPTAFGDLALFVLRLAQHAASPWPPCSGLRSPPPGEAPWSERGGHTSTTTTRRQRSQSEQKAPEKIDITKKTQNKQDASRRR
jgi:hypothetical protein